MGQDKASAIFNYAKGFDEAAGLVVPQFISATEKEKGVRLI